MQAFEDLKKAEVLLHQYKPSGNDELDYRQLLSLLAQERVLDACRSAMFDQYPHGSSEAKDYVFREYMVRHQISQFALSLSKTVTDKITGVNPEEKSFLAGYIKNRELYPEPRKSE